MDASKEAGREALAALKTQKSNMNEAYFNCLKDFLEAAIRKLPSKEAFNRSRANKRVRDRASK